jgi:hypothetical protein
MFLVNSWIILFSGKIPITFSMYREGTAAIIPKIPKGNLLSVSQEIFLMDEN